MKRHIVFSDVDGTLLNSEHRISPLTRQAIGSLEDMKIPFVIISARSPSGIYPILCEHNFNCPIISYSGGLILDADKNILFNTGMTKERAESIIYFIKRSNLDLSWCVYSLDEWLVENKDDPRIIREEKIVKTQSNQGTVSALADGAMINKILCICNPNYILDIEHKISIEFPDCSVVKSSDILLEIMEKGVTKGQAVQNLCALWEYDIVDAIAFGDNYNDVDMLEVVGHGFLMGNAPEPLKEIIGTLTLSNNHDGIYHALKNMKIFG